MIMKYVEQLYKRQNNKNKWSSEPIVALLGRNSQWNINTDERIFRVSEPLYVK